MENVIPLIHLRFQTIEDQTMPIAIHPSGILDDAAGYGR